MYSVYIHTFPNGKKYVGVTSRKPYLRWGANGCNYRNSPFLYNAIQKYGWDNIKHEIIAENLSVEEASKIEIELISKYKTSEKKYGYNISLGGVGNLGIVSDLTKEKLRNANLGKTMSKESRSKISAYQKQQSRSEETRRNMSIAQKKNFANGNNAIHSKEAREKAAEKNRGRKPSKYAIQKASKAKYHSVINIKTGIVYESIKEAAEKNGIDRTTIIRHCNGKIKNKKWKYAK